jgi:cysteine synthase B
LAEFVCVAGKVGQNVRSDEATASETVRGLLSFVGNTPLLRVESLAVGLPPSVEVYGKAEWFNPAGSVKDRPARAILLQALSTGALPSRTLLDSTSGNMGIAYATFSASLGVRVHLAIPANAGRLRLDLLRSLGAELTLTDPLEGSDGARLVAAEMAAQAPSEFYFADQYSNRANWEAHWQATGPEVWEQTQGSITHFVAGLGTTGTMTGAGRFLREVAPHVRLVGVQPDGPIHGLEGLKHLATSPVPPIFDPGLPDEIVVVPTDEAYSMAVRLARGEGWLVSASSAAAVWAALRVARTLEQGVVVAMLPDSGLKYLQGPPWTMP